MRRARPFDDLPQPGDRVGGRYCVERTLGAGATGVVYEASHELTGKRVAIKWLRPELAASDAQTARFLREARTATAIDHPNVVAVFDAGREKGTLFLVMERLEGEPLTAFLARGPHSVDALVATLMPALRGVAAAHRHGIVHRDLKPDNVFLAAPRRGWPGGAKVLDFGTSKLKQPEDGRELTHAGVFLGTPLYMAPEQIVEPGKVDARADVYSIGVMLYEGLAGRPPFDSDAVHELFRQVMSEAPPPLRRVRPDLPASIDALVMSALSRDPDDRPPSVAALARALEPYGAARFDDGGIASAETIALPLDDGRTEIVRSPLDDAHAPTVSFELRGAEPATRPAIALPDGSIENRGEPATAPRTMRRAPSLPDEVWEAIMQHLPEPLRSTAAVLGVALGLFVVGLLFGLLF